MKEIKLGDKVKDSVTGFKGIAVGRTEYLHGCIRITIQPEGMNKEGKTFECETFDEPQVIKIGGKLKKGQCRNRNN